MSVSSLLLARREKEMFLGAADKSIFKWDDCSSRRSDFFLSPSKLELNSGRQAFSGLYGSVH